MGTGLLVVIPIVILIGTAAWVYRSRSGASRRTDWVLTWLREAQKHDVWAVRAGAICGDAPFQMPTRGLIGFLWDDLFRAGHRHQGIDIFGGGEVNETPVYAAYAGYLTRLPDWKSSVIVRIPEDPLHPGRQIWAYYTHMADPDGELTISDEFPPGTREVPIEAGKLLGFQGNYSGQAGNPVGVHLHFSIVRDDGEGQFLNELEIQNTLDPSPYLGLALNAKTNPDQIPTCLED